MVTLPQFMPAFRLPLKFAATLCLLALAVPVRAHQVPNMSMEADFGRNRGFTLRINLDPRLVLTDQPTTLAPVPGSWYLERSEAERAKIHEDTLRYLKSNLELVFGSETAPLPKLEIVPIDAAENQPLAAETEEMHLLASGRGVLPGSAAEFSVRLGRGANVSLVLLNRVEGQEEPSLRVIFPGETGQAFALEGIRSLDEMLGAAGAPATQGPSASFPWIMRGGIMLLLLITWLLFRGKWQAPPRGRPRRF